MNNRLADLNDLTKAQLKSEWETCFGAPPPARIRRDFLIRNLAWQRQAAQHGELSKKAKRQLRQLAAAFTCAFRRSRSVIPWEADQSFQFKPITEHARVAGCRYCAK